DPNIILTKGKVAKITEDPETKDVIVVVEDISGGSKVTGKFDMVVLAAGMVPGTKDSTIGIDIPLTEEGFVNAPVMKKGIYAVGTLKSPVDVARSVQDATGATVKSIQSLKR
ncbi:MAG: heterodisulfide reductase subunit A, partial [Nitrospirae bacterium]|nr:heterodisulfide reductase subunit A [Nitrospirota bacterium]